MDRINLVLAIAVLGVMTFLILLAILNMAQRGGSLDNLSKEEIAKRVGQ